MLFTNSRLGDYKYLARCLVAASVSIALAVIVFAGCGGAGGGNGLDTQAKDCPGCATGVITGEGTGKVDPLPATVKAVDSFKAYAGPAITDQPHYLSSKGEASTGDALIAAVQALPKDPDKSISIQVLPDDPSKVGPRAVSVGCVWMDVRWEYGYIGGCVRRNGWHLNFHIRNKCDNRELFNLHVTGWRQNGPQVGMYESASGWCAQSRGTWTEIRDRFMGAFAVVGIGGYTAYILSNMAAGVTVGAFAL